MPLTDVTIRNVKPGSKPIKLADGHGLYLEVTPSGRKWWALKYRFDRKEKRISLGVYPEVGLKEAREKRDEARKLLAAGVDPSAQRKATKAARAEVLGNSFEVVALEWYAKYSPKWAEKHAERVLRRLKKDIFPWVGKRPVSELNAAEILKVIQRIEARGLLETAHRALGHFSQVLRYAVQTQRATRNPTPDLRGAIPPAKVSHFAAMLEPIRLGEILRAMDGYKGTFVVKCAMRLSPLLFTRPGELRRAEWSEFDLEAAEWRFLVTKTQTQHIVPLSTQAVEILRELKPLTGDGRLLFPGLRDKERPISDNTLLAGLRRMDIQQHEMSIHGFRAVARTHMDEHLGVRPDFLEHQLAHAVRDTNGRAYNRTSHLTERRKMMQVWADYLDKLKAGEKVMSFSPASGQL